jgi:hypothetical protein
MITLFEKPDVTDDDDDTEEAELVKEDSRRFSEVKS